MKEITPAEQGEIAAREEYNGWKNKDTWNANLWLTNDEGCYLEVKDMLNEDMIENYFRRVFKTDNGYIDGINPNLVDWQNIYISLR